MQNSHKYNGIINIYKPLDWTSHDVVAKVRGILGMKKVGHAGTLDPNADGVLLVCVGRATKRSEELMLGTKQYLATMLLCTTTDTQDITGNVVAMGGEVPSVPEIKAAVNKYVGVVEQIPPMYSAVKKGGKKLYELARKGIEIEREPRKITVHSIEICDVAPPLVTMRIRCSKGTYIRTLCHDIGQDLGCGACLQALTREASGEYRVQDSITLEELADVKEQMLGGAVE